MILNGVLSPVRGIRLHDELHGSLASRGGGLCDMIGGLAKAFGGPTIALGALAKKESPLFEIVASIASDFEGPLEVTYSDAFPSEKPRPKLTCLAGGGQGDGIPTGKLRLCN
jgi:hypothetical protein